MMIRTLLARLGLGIVLLVWGGLFGALAEAAEMACAGVNAPTTHPRLFLRHADLDRLRGWATDANPIYREGLKRLAENGVQRMDSGRIPGDDNGGSTYSPVYTETWAHLFAFMSLVAPTQAEREAYAQRGRTLLMTVINAADQGLGEGRWRALSFSSSDRSRWAGQGFGLAVDWLYPCLSATDKAAIRRVFIRWSDEAIAGYPSLLYFHTNPSSVPAGPAGYNNPVLLDLGDPKRSAARYAMNNYFMGHARNLALMSMSMDAVDDVPDARVSNDAAGRLRGYLNVAVQQFLYMSDYAFRNDGRGGLSFEGSEYMHSLAFPLQTVLALRTAGEDDPAKWGTQVDIRNHPFWDHVVAGVIHSLPTRKVVNPTYGLQVYQPSWYGDGEHYFLPDESAIFGTLGVYRMSLGDLSTLPAIRWATAETPPGGSAGLLSRARNDENLTNVILYFLLFDPQAAGNPAFGPAVDPRPGMPTAFYSPGMGRAMSRTGWDADARMFNYKLSWTRIDHQHGDGNGFDFNRKGEWLTKERTGYGNVAASSDYKNTLTLQNDPPGHSIGLADIHLARGSQFGLNAASGDPPPPIRAETSTYSHFTGDATALYNFYRDQWTPRLAGVLHASRTAVWLKPDHIVVYDRARSQNDNRYKRFWLNLPSTPTFNGNRTLATTPGGQQLAVTTVLPAGAQPTLVTTDPTLESWSLAEYDPMAGANGSGTNRLMVEAPGAPRDARFLHLLQGADGGAAPDAATVLHSSSGDAFDGVAFNTWAVLFSREMNQPFTGFSYRAPAAATQQMVTGLSAGTSYGVTVTPDANGNLIQVSNAGSGVFTVVADGGGALVFTVMPGTPQPPTCAASVNPAAITTGQQATVSASCNPAATGYVWTNPAGGPAASGATVQLSFPAAGTYCYAVAGSNAAGGGATSAAACVTVTTPPPQAPACTVAAAPAQITAGQQATLSANCSPAASSYAWTNPASGPAAAGAASQLSFGTAGTYCYAVRGTNAGGQGAASNPACVTVTAVPVPVPTCTVTATPAQIVAGQQATVSASCNPAAATYAWTNPANGPAVVGASAQLTFPSAGSYCYAVQGSNVGGSGVVSNSSCVQVSPAGPAAPVCRTSVTPSSARVGEPVTFSAQCNPAPTGIEWTQPDGAPRVSGLQTRLEFARGGTYCYRMRGSSSAGWGGWSDESCVTIQSNSVPALTPQTGWYWNAAESGRGFFIEMQGNRLFISGFLYAESGRATWFVASGELSSTRFAAPMREFAGGQTLSGAYRTPREQPNSGEVVLDFNSPTEARLSWGRGESILLQRFPFAPSGQVEPAAGNSAESGWWWNAEESGRGFALEIQADRVFLVGYMYDAEGNPVWHLSTGRLESPSRYSGDWVTYGNGQTRHGSYKPAQVVNGGAGRVQIDFDGRRTATLTLPDGRRQVLTRFVF